MTRYEAWVHEILGIYAVRLEKGQITGISGPLPLNAAPEADHLAGLEYDDRAAVVRRVRERLESGLSSSRSSGGGMRRHGRRDPFRIARPIRSRSGPPGRRAPCWKRNRSNTAERRRLDVRIRWTRFRGRRPGRSQNGGP